MPRFFVETVSEEYVTVSGADGAHLQKVLRVRPGEHVTLCDGKGTDADCVVTELTSGEVRLRVEHREPNITEPSLKLRLYPCFLKGDKFEFVVQKAVELGAASITPVLSARVVSRPDEKARRTRTERLQKIALEAAGQCERGCVPTVGEFLSFSEALTHCPKPAVLFYEGGGVPLRSLTPSQTLSVFVGPEGGFEPSEIEEARCAGVTIASLGPRILRAETADLIAAALLLYQSGDM